jgi:hypothetical protein
MINNCPCTDCICVPVCQNKTWAELVTSCTFICEYFRDHEITIKDNGNRMINITPLNQSYRVTKGISGLITWASVGTGSDHVVGFYPAEEGYK